MSLPFGFRYFRNMAIYPHRTLAEAYLSDYGKDLEKHYDEADKTTYKERVFCLDCPTFETCRGRFWKGCPTRAEVLRIMKGGEYLGRR